ncbi:MAG: NAD(P)/FAD-dependent oxidoreductase [Candidatus Rokuibacteriota bacterium]
MLVIGGGPAGSTFSALAAERGWRVTLLEKEHHPRFHIGESLLPLNLPLFRRLGVLDQIEHIGMLKPGAEFNHEGYPPAVFYFANALEKSHPIAYQVRRSEFDHVLLKNSAAKGTDVREGVRVTDVEFRSGQTTLVHTMDEAGGGHTWEARLVVDASGRDTLLASRFKMKARNRQHNSAAVFGHFSGVERRSGRDAGNISMYWFDHGWYWMIPLKDGAMSVGAVCWADYLKSRTKPVDDFLWDTLRLNPLVAERMKNATLMAPALATGNFSYQARRMYGDGYLLIGDAFAFIDPVFSTGVFLAMKSAELGVEVADDMLRTGDVSVKGNRAALRRYETTMRRGLRTFSWFIYRITTPRIRKMFLKPRNVFRMEEGVLSLLSADIFGDTPVRRPLFMFKLAYYVLSTLEVRESLAAWRRRRRAWRSRLDFVWKSGT